MIALRYPCSARRSLQTASPAILRLHEGSMPLYEGAIKAVLRHLAREALQSKACAFKAVLRCLALIRLYEGTWRGRRYSRRHAPQTASPAAGPRAPQLPHTGLVSSIQV